MRTVAGEVRFVGCVVLAFVLVVTSCGGSDQGSVVSVGSPNSAEATTAELPVDKIRRHADESWFNYGADPDTEYPLVVVTNSVWMALVDLFGRCVGAFDRGHLVPPGESPHGYELSTADGAMLMAADLIITSGGNLIDGLELGIEEAEDGGAEVFRFTDHISSPISSTRPTDIPDEVDPHVWLDPVRTGEAFDVLMVRLGEVLGSDPDELDLCRENAATWLAVDDDTAREEFAAIPLERRVLITTSDAFEYLADRYGFEIISIERTSLDDATSVVDAVAPAQRERFNAVINTELQPVIFVDAESQDETIQQLDRLDDIDRFGITPLHLESIFEDPIFDDDGPNEAIGLSTPTRYSELIYFMSDLIRADLTETESAVRRWAED